MTPATPGPGSVARYPATIPNGRPAVGLAVRRWTPTVGLLIADRTVRDEIASVLQDLGYPVAPEGSTEHLLSHLNDAGLLIVDEPMARRHGAALLRLKQRSGAVFLPLVLLLPPEREAGTWLHSGFDDVLHPLVSRAELAVRLSVLARLRQQSERQYQSVFENAPIGIYRLSPERRIVMANWAMAQMLGFASTDELLAWSRDDRRDLLQWDHHPDRAAFWHEVQQRGRVTGRELRWERRDGSTLWVRESLQAVLDATGRPICYEGTVEDITESRRAAEALRQREQYYGALLKRSTDILSVVDAAGVFVFDSPSVERVLGYQPGERLGTTIFAYHHPDDVDAARAAFERLLQHPGAVVTAQLRVRHKDGSWRVIEGTRVNLLHDPVVAGVIVNTRDVTERVRAEVELQRREEELRALVDNTPDIIVRVDPAGRYRFVNARFEDAIGLPASACLGNTKAELGAPPGLSAAADAARAQVFASGKPASIEFASPTRQGMRYFQEVMAPEFETDGSVRSVVGIARDMTELKEATDALRERERRLQALLDNALDAVLVTDEQGRYVDVNPAACALFGRSRDEFLRLRVADVVDLEPDDATDRLWQQFISTGEQEGVIRIRRPDGERRLLEYRAKTHFVPGLHLSILRDITERLRTQQALQESEARFRTVFESAPIGIALVTLDGSARVMAANPALAKMLGYSEAELCTKTIADITCPDDLPRERQHFQEIAAGLRSHYQIEKRYVRKDGAIVWGRLFVSLIQAEHGEMSFALGMVEDITERKQAEEALRESEARFRSIFEGAAIGIAVRDIERGLLICNPVLEEMLGYSEAELRDLPAAAYVHPDDLTVDQQLAAELVAGQRDRYQVEKRYIRKDGQTLWCRLTLSLTGDAEHRRNLKISMLEDITERKQAEEALRESEDRYALAARGANDGLWDWNLKTGEVFYSSRWKAMIGCAEEEIGTDPEEWLARIAPDQVGEVRAKLAAHLAGQTDYFSSEYRMRHRDGSYRWMLSRGLAVRQSDGTADRIAGSQTDVTERKRAEDRLLHDAFHDPLTNLPNRALFVDRLAQALARASRHPAASFAVFFLDLDRFKIVNDSLGHLTGDRLLIEAARRLQTCVRPGDTVARLGGDEFTILLEEIEHPGDAVKVAERIQERLRQPILLDGVELFTSTSIGIALGGEGYTQPDQLLRDADTAMYSAKSLGRDRYEIFDARMHTQALERLRLETDLRRAIERDEFRLFYHPIIALESGRIAWFEALLRWDHPRRGIVLPAEFIPAAEETGLIATIGRWVLREACQQMRAWRDRSPDQQPVTISVNLSARQLCQPDLPGYIGATLAESGLSGEDLRLEITETTVMERPELAHAILGKLKSMGVQLHIDDFGTGYSSLSVLHNFPFNTLKIDRSFVRSIGPNGEQAEVARAIVAMAHSLDLRVIAEGVETPEQLALVRALGCDYAQGFAFAQPLNADEATELILSRPCW